MWPAIISAALNSQNKQKAVAQAPGIMSSSFGMNQGDWTVNVAGSGTANQSGGTGATGGLPTWAMIAAAGAVVWYLLK